VFGHELSKDFYVFGRELSKDFYLFGHELFENFYVFGYDLFEDFDVFGLKRVDVILRVVFQKALGEARMNWNTLPITIML